MTIHYSQYGEQEFLLDYFGCKTDGFLVDIGANDGLVLSNTRALVERGWNAVLVEPKASTYGTLCINNDAFPKVKTVWAAITSMDASTTRLYIDSQESTRCSLLPSMKVQFAKNEDKFEDVPAMTPWSLVKHCRAHIPQTFDLLCIDAEGMDLMIVQLWPFALACPDLIMTETMHGGGEEVSISLRNVGYLQIWNNSVNTAWARTKETD